MRTETQDTHPQDPIERFALHVEGLRRMRVPRGLAWIVHRLLVAFFTYLLRVAADIAEQRRNGTLPEMAPVSGPDHQPRAWRSELRPRESGWLEQRSHEAACGGSVHGPFEQPEIKQPIVEQAAALPLPRRARVRKCKGKSGPAPARLRHVDDGGWARWRGPGIVWTAEVGSLGFDSKKWALAGGDSYVHFVTI
jgi:hypothetical protein